MNDAMRFRGRTRGEFGLDVSQLFKLKFESTYEMENIVRWIAIHTSSNARIELLVESQMLKTQLRWFVTIVSSTESIKHTLFRYKVIQMLPKGKPMTKIFTLALAFKWMEKHTSSVCLRFLLLNLHIYCVISALNAIRWNVHYNASSPFVAMLRKTFRLWNTVVMECRFHRSNIVFLISFENVELMFTIHERPFIHSKQYQSECSFELAVKLMLLFQIEFTFVLRFCFISCTHHFHVALCSWCNNKIS